jgi:O-antigen/teichoic acid export membrane protein
MFDRIASLASHVRAALNLTAMPPLVAQLAGNALWSTLGVVISRGLQFLSYIVIARTLGSAGFGRFGLIQSTLGMFAIIGTFGLGMTATRYIAKYRHLDSAKAGRIISLSRTVAATTGGIAAIGLYFSADWLAGRTLRDPLLGPLLKIAAINLVLTAVNAAQMGTLSGFQAFKSIAHVNLIAGVIAFPTTIVFVRSFGITGGVWALNVGGGLLCIFSSLALKRICRNAGIAAQAFSWKEDAPILFGFSLPAALSAAMTAPATWLANATLVGHPGGLVQIGLFSAANSVRTLLLYLPIILIQSSFPVLASAYARGGDRREFRSVLVMTHNWINVPVVAMGILAMFSAPAILTLFGPEYRQGSTAFVVLMAATVIQALGCGVGATVQARGDMWFAFSANATWAVSYLLVVWCLAGQLGATSLSLGNCIAYAVLLCCQIWKLRGDLPSRMETKIYVGAALTLAGPLLATSLDSNGFSVKRVALALLLAALVGVMVRIHPAVRETIPLEVAV